MSGSGDWRDDVIKDAALVTGIVGAGMAIGKVAGMVADAFSGYYECPRCGKRYSGNQGGKSVKCSCGTNLKFE